MIELNTFKQLMEENEDCLPLLTLEEFFCENPNEDAIAPNQCGYGRPSLSEIWEAFQNMEQMPNVAWVRVALHDDTEIEECDGEEELYLSGDSIIICTSAQVSEMEKLVNCEWLCSGGIMEVPVSSLSIYSHVPSVPEGFRCLEIEWD